MKTLNPRTQPVCLAVALLVICGIWPASAKPINDASSDLDDAQAIGGSPSVSIISPGNNQNEYVLNFVVPVRAFGFWVLHYHLDANQPIFTAYNSMGQVIEEVTFGAEFRQGTISTTVDYGFMGISANQDIASVRIQQNSTEFDNLYFSRVLEPSPSIRVSQVEVCFDTMTNYWYRLDYQNTLSTNQWTPLNP
jgi:hypothetical protein